MPKTQSLEAKQSSPQRMREIRILYIKKTLSLSENLNSETATQEKQTKSQESLTAIKNLVCNKHKLHRRSVPK
jgi:hypothetical protein